MPPSDESKNNYGKLTTGKLNAKNRIQFKGFWLNGQPFLVLLMPKSSGCAYHELAREFAASLQWDKNFFDSNHDRCYCSQCYKESWKDVIEAGEGKYVIPRGWVRLGLHIDPVLEKTQDIWNKWIVTFHGTTKIAAQSILAHRQFCMPGDVLIDGTKLRIRPGHIPGQMFIYTSPTIAYSSGPAYSPIYDFHSTENDANYETQIVLHCRQMPNSFKIGPETIGAKTEICPHIPNSEIEYFTDRRASLVAYGLLVRFRPKNT
jgi:neuralized-like protein 4